MKDFLDVLIENHQAQIAGFYNDDKTDAERAKRNAVIEEYQDLIAIYKANYSAPPSPVGIDVEELKKIKEAFQWTWDHIGEPHTSDHFNIPANGIHAIERLIYENAPKELPQSSTGGLPKLDQPILDEDDVKSNAAPPQPLGIDVEAVWNAACKQLLSDISDTFLNPENLKKADSPTDRDVFKGVGETIKNFPIPPFKNGYAADHHKKELDIYAESNKTVKCLSEMYCDQLQYLSMQDFTKDRRKEIIKGFSDVLINTLK